MTQKQLDAMHERQDLQRKQPTASKPCGDDATLSEITTDEGNRRHIEFIQCTTRQRIVAQREQEVAQREQEVVQQEVVQQEVVQQEVVQQEVVQQAQEQREMELRIERARQQRQACLDGVAEDLQAVQACVALPEKSDDEVIVKAGCLTQRLRSARDAAIRLDNTCGHFNLVEYVDHQLEAAKIEEAAARIDAKAKDPRARVAARESVCKAANVIEFEQRQLDRERAIEHESGVADLVRRREIGSTLVLFKQQYQAALIDYQRLWKRSFRRARDCVAPPSLRGVVKLGSNAKDKVRDGAAIEVSLHVPNMGDAGRKRLVWHGDAVAFEFEKVTLIGRKVVGGDVEVRVRRLDRGTRSTSSTARGTGGGARKPGAALATFPVLAVLTLGPALCKAAPRRPGVTTPTGQARSR